MKKILIQSATIADPASPEKGKVKDILIEDGIIARLGEKIRAAGAEKIDATGCYVSPGWVDLHTNIGDPGLETMEVFLTAAAAAAAGGFTGLTLLPNNNPPSPSESEKDHLHSRTREFSVAVYPSRCISYWP